MGTITAPGTAVRNVIKVDDKEGNHYWIFDILHTSGDDTNIEVPTTILSAAEIPSGAATAGDVTIVADVTAGDGLREIQIDTGEATGVKKIIARFRGSPSGMGGGFNA